MRLAGFAIIIFGVVGVSFFAGFEVGERNLFPYTLLGKIDRKLTRIFSSGRDLDSEAQPRRLESQIYNSHLIQLTSDVGIVETGRNASSDWDSGKFVFRGVSENGGGLTSFGSDVLLLPYNGVIYAANSPNDIRATQIATPDNNRTAYQTAANDPAFAEYNFHRGLLRYNDLKFVEFAKARALVASYTEYHSDRACYTNTLARLDIDSTVDSIDEISAGHDDWEIIYRTKPCLPLKTRYLALEGTTAAGRIVFQAPSTIFLASGDFHHDGMRSDGPGIAQDAEAQYGKVIAIDLLTGAEHILSIGHRNPAGLTLTARGQLIVAEQGPRGGDELNLIRGRTNFGWPLESYGTTYRGTRIPGSLSYGRHNTFETPIFAWVPSVAVSSLTVVENFHPAWDGDLLVGSLKDRSLHRIRMAGDRVIYNERIEIGSRIRAVHQHTDGRLVLWTDNQELIFLTAKDRLNIDVTFERFVKRSRLSVRIANRLETAVSRCAECHSFEVDDHQTTPSLARIYGDRIAATTFDDYSDALRGKSGRWTHESLTVYLTNPQEFAPGSSMPPTQIEDKSVLDALISYLEDLDQQF